MKSISFATGRKVAALLLLLFATVTSPVSADTVRVGIIDVRGTSTIYPVAGVSIKHREFLPAKATAARQLTEQGHEHGNLMLNTLARQFRELNPATPLEIYSADAFVTTGPPKRPHYSSSFLKHSRPSPLGLYTEGALNALEWFQSQNVSLLVFAGVGKDTDGIRQLVENAQSRGILIVASTHNEQAMNRGYPAAYPGVFAVAGSDSGLAIHKDVDLATYVDLVTSGSSYEMGEVEASGSSFAAARAAGFLLAWKATHPNRSFEEGALELTRQAPFKPFGNTTIVALPTLFTEDVRGLLYARGLKSSRTPHDAREGT